MHTHTIMLLYLKHSFIIITAIKYKMNISFKVLFLSSHCIQGMYLS